MRIEPLELTYLPYDFLTKITTIPTTITTTATTTITTDATINTATNCNVVFERSYCSRDLLHLNSYAKDSKLPRRRTAFTDQQLSLLENAFEKCQYPKMDMRMRLAAEMQLPEMCIQVWFKNRRAKYRKKLRNIANSEITSDNFVPKLNTVITWKPNVTLVFVTSFRETMACRRNTSNMIGN